MICKNSTIGFLRKIDSKIDRKIDIKIHRKIDRKIEEQKKGQKDRKTETQKDRKTELTCNYFQLYYLSKCTLNEKYDSQTNCN